MAEDKKVWATQGRGSGHPGKVNASSAEIRDESKIIVSGKPPTARNGTDGGPQMHKHPEFPGSYRK